MTAVDRAAEQDRQATGPEPVEDLEAERIEIAGSSDPCEQVIISPKRYDFGEAWLCADPEDVVDLGRWL